jgi:tripartite-type tricarboxylate transporter receptor subunit TctC
LGTFAPAGTPRPIIDRLNGELKKTLADPDTAAKRSAQTLDSMHTSPEQFAKLIQSDYERLRDVVKMSGARIE